MRLATVRSNGAPRLAALLGEDRAVLLEQTDCLALLRGGEAALEEARRVVARAEDGAGGAIVELAAVELLPPVPHPPKILCAARNYADHVAEVRKPLPEVPILFPRFAQTLVAPGQPIVRPWVSDQLDWEGELAVVIGRHARHVSREEAYDVVAGYSLFNDVTVRDYQLRAPQYTAGKNFDASGPFGPTLVTKDEVPDPMALELRVDLNGERVQTASTGEMIFGVRELIAHISEWITLEPGDVIATGTPAGTGFAHDPKRFLRPGDRIGVEIAELGRLENPVAQEPR